MEASSVGERGAGYRVLAFDFDGTLTDDPPPRPAVLAALAEVRRSGMRLVLVTGRIVAELAAVFPDFEDHVDAVVAENGAVLSRRGRTVHLARPIDPRLLDALDAAGVANRRGEVIAAASATDYDVICREVRRLGLTVTIALNRNELMLVPAGVTKTTGLRVALSALDLSIHDTVAVGDADNDVDLLEAAELGVAVATAVPALRERADLVLTGGAGDGIVELCASGLLADRAAHRTMRRRLVLGPDASGAPVELPAAPIDIIVAGSSGSGKSYVAGLLAEQLILHGYSVLVIDPEGDHAGMDSLPGVVVVGGDRYLPSAPSLVLLFTAGHGSVVVDLSHLDRADQDAYLATLPAEIETHRRLTGQPHWLVLDEAHRTAGGQGVSKSEYAPTLKGHCLVTWQVGWLTRPQLMATDVMIAATSPEPPEDLAAMLAAVGAGQVASAAVLLTRPLGQVVVARRDRPGELVVATPTERATLHTRHEHKYELHGLDDAHAFHVRDGQDRPTGVLVRSLDELREVIASCPPDVLIHHCRGGDWSRWVGGVFHDHVLAAALSAAERRLVEGGPVAVDPVRQDVIAALRARRAT